MPDSRNNRPLVFALTANAVALALIALALFARSGPSFVSSAMAQQQLPIGGGAGVFIVPGQFTANSYGCYLMDIDAQTLCAYQYMPAEKQLRLIAARSFRYDRRLENYNTGITGSGALSPLEVKDLVEKQQAEVRARDASKTPASPEEPAKKD